MIRDLQEENEKLKALLASGGRPEKIKNEDDDDDEDDDEDEKELSEEGYVYLILNFEIIIFHFLYPF